MDQMSGWQDALIISDELSSHRRLGPCAIVLSVTIDLLRQSGRPPNSVMKT